MSTPNPNDPSNPNYNRVDPDAPVAAPPRNSSALLWLLLLVALVAAALWWFGKKQADMPADAPTTTDQPAIDEGATAAKVEAERAATAAKAAKPAAKPKPASITRDASPLASNERPKYPTQALRSGVEGSVSVRVEVDANGNVTDASVVERTGERSRDLDRAVLQAVRNWKFDPAMKDGKPVATAVVVPVEFKSE